MIEVRRGSAMIPLRWARSARGRGCELAARVVALIRIDAIWLATAPLDMRAGTDTALARIVKVFSAGSLRAGQRAAAIMSLIQSARLNGHDVFAGMKDVLERLPTLPNSRISELLPHRWRLAA